MADYYNVYTVLTKIPFDLTNSSDLSLLKAFGVNWEDCEKDHTRYFFSEGSLAELSLESPEAFLGQLTSDYSDNESRPYWVTQLVTELKGKDIDDVHIDLDSVKISWEDIFRGILNKKENTRKDPLVAIEVMGSYGCSKVTPGAFVGWAIRITKDRVLSAGVEDILRKMRKMRKGVDITARQSEPLNQYQKVFKERYGEGIYSYIQSADEAENGCDTLFLFLMRELSTSEGCDSLNEAVRRLNAAETDLGGCIEALMEDAENTEMV